MNRTSFLSTLAALVLLSATGWLVAMWWPTSSPDAADVSDDVETSSDPIQRVQLTAAKAELAGIRTEAVGRRDVTLSRTLPARFAYDDRSHVAVRAPTDGMIEEIFVKPGDVVSVGTPLAIVRSPAIGEARGKVLRFQAELKLAETQRDWQSDICDGVVKLAEQIRQGKPVGQVQSGATDDVLGNYRGRLLSLYNQSSLASKLSQSANASSGAISGRVVRERQSEQQQSQAELDAAIEQSIFETNQACKTATANAETARRNWTNAKQSLATLTGMPGDQAESIAIDESATDLSRLEIQSPLAGTVERKVFSSTERVTQDAEMFVIADTKRLWVEADIRGGDWAAMNVQAGDRVVVTTPAMPEQRHEGAVFYIGREVDPASGAVPLVIEIDNSAGGFRPGLFARVEVPVAVKTNVIAVPGSAVMDLDGQHSVFLRSDEANAYVPVAVRVGDSSGDWTEVIDGVREGDQVVVDGTFVLKSELLLEGEE